MTGAGARLAALLTLLLLAGTSSSAAAVPEDDLLQTVRIVFDPAAEPQARATGLARLRQRADGGHAESQYLVGTLYRLGRRHPAALVPEDGGRAAMYLSNAAVQGERQALAAMAELRLAQSQPREAAVWGHAYAHFVDRESQWLLEAGRLGPRERDSFRAYSAWLLARCMSALGGDAATHAAVAQDVNAFLARYSEAIEAAMRSAHESTTRASLRWRQGPDTRFVRAQRADGPGMALFVGRSTGQGSLASIILVDGLPDARHGRYLRRELVNVRVLEEGGRDDVFFWLGIDDGVYRFAP